MLVIVNSKIHRIIVNPKMLFEKHRRMPKYLIISHPRSNLLLIRRISRASLIPKVPILKKLISMIHLIYLYIPNYDFKNFFDSSILLK
jgi:hypothetical protein